MAPRRWRALNLLEELDRPGEYYVDRGTGLLYLLRNTLIGLSVWGLAYGAVVLALRETAKRLGTRSLSGLTVFTTVEPCAMCVGALLEADADCLVYALSDPVAGAAGSVVQLANNPALPRRLDLISGILRSDAAELAEVAARREP